MQHFKSAFIGKRVLILLFVGIFNLLVFDAFAYRLKYDPKVTIGEEYTDNSNLARFNEQEEYITIISPAIALDFEGKEGGINALYNPSVSIYRKHDENNTLRQKITYSQWQSIAKDSKIEIADSFLRTEEPKTSLDNYARRKRQPYYLNSTDVSFINQFGPLSKFNLKYHYSFLDNKDPTVEDNSQHSPKISLSYFIVPYQLTFNVASSYTKGEFDGPTDDFDRYSGSIGISKNITRQFSTSIDYLHSSMHFSGASDNYQVYQPSVGIDYRLSEETELKMSIGYFYLDNTQKKDDGGLTINGNIGKSYRLKHGVLEFNGSSGYEESYFGSENLGFDKYIQAKGSFEYYFTRRFLVYTHGKYRKDRYIRQENLRKDWTRDIGVGLQFNKAGKVSFSIGYTYTSLSSTIKENEYDENRISANVTLSPLNK